MKKLNLIILFTIFFLPTLLGQKAIEYDYQKHSYEDSIRYFHPALINNPNFTGKDTIYDILSNNDSTSIMIINAYKLGELLRTDSYYPNGNKCEEFIYNLTDKDYLKIFYHKNGELKNISYSKGKRRPIIAVSWNERGETELIFDHKTRKVIEWTEYGTLKEIVNNKEDEKKGELVCCYHNNGRLMSKVIYNSGKQEFKQYFNNGNLEFKGYYINDTYNRIGKWVEYYENGQIKKEYSFSEKTPELKNGVWLWWDEKGILIKKEYYKNGKLITK
jgi:antitoxin component YwqK of YwqJK toxin-antitoxin module